LQNTRGRKSKKKQFGKTKKRRNLNNSGSISRLKKFLIFLLVLIITAGGVFIFANQYLFKVKNFNIIENSMYTREDIIKASGIEEGAELFGFNVRLAKDNIERELAYAESVSIIRLLPSTVRINIKTDEPVFGFTLGRDYYIVTDKLRVAEKISMGGDFKPPGVINIVTDYVIKCFVGEMIEFSDKDIPDFLRELIRLVKDEKTARMISSVDIRDKFNVVMNYSDLYLVRFGVFENVYSKAVSSFDVIEQLSELTGIIDMSDEQIASFTTDENITNNRLYFDKK